MTKSEILDTYRVALGYSTDAEFAAFLDVSKSAFSNWKQRDSFKEKVLLEKIPNINPQFLTSGSGSPFQKGKPHTFEESDSNMVNEAEGPYVINNKKVISKLRTDEVRRIQQIPLYDIEASAGVVSLFNRTDEQEPLDYISIPNLPSCDGAIYVTGDSMYPVLKSGDIVMYKSVAHQEKFFIWGEMYIVSFQVNGDDYISVKWVQKSELGNDHIKLVSANQHHQEIDIPMQSINALALIKGSVRFNSMK